MRTVLRTRHCLLLTLLTNNCLLTTEVALNGLVAGVATVRTQAVAV